MVGNGARRSEARLGVVADRVQRRPQRRLPAPQPGLHQNEVHELLRPRPHPVPARAGARVHGLRSLVLVGDGTDVAEPLLPARGRRPAATRPTCRWACRRRPRSGSGWPTAAGPAKNYYSSALPWYSLAFPANSFSGDDAIVAGDAGSLLPRRRARHAAQPRDHRPRLRGSTTATRPTISRCARRSSPASTARWPRARSGRARCSWSCSTSTAASSITSRRRRREDPDPEFRQLGFRVPAIVAGPRCGAARWCRRRSSTCRSRPR